MSRQHIIAEVLLLIALFAHFSPAANVPENREKNPVVITSDTLIADNKNNTALFEGSVVARTEDITMYSDRMTVFYDSNANKIMKILAKGSVKVHKNERAIFSEEATYLDEEGKIIFSGNPRAVEGENVITGKQIIFFIEDERAIVEGSRVILQNTQELK